MQTSSLETRSAGIEALVLLRMVDPDRPADDGIPPGWTQGMRMVVDADGCRRRMLPSSDEVDVTEALVDLVRAPVLAEPVRAGRPRGAAPRRKPWTTAEDVVVTRHVRAVGPRQWSRVAAQLPGRRGKQCRERWHNQLNPEIRKDPWTWHEEVILSDAHGRFNNQWAAISALLPGRSDNAIKNHWNCAMRTRASA
jgi:hypothetical protein